MGLHPRASTHGSPYAFARNTDSCFTRSSPQAAAQNPTIVNHNSFQDPEFITQVINQIDSERRACGHPHEILLEGCRVLVYMPRIAMINIQLLYAMRQLEFHQEGNELRVRVKDLRSMDDRRLEEYISYLAAKAQVGATRALSCAKYYLEDSLPF